MDHTADQAVAGSRHPGQRSADVLHLDGRRLDDARRLRPRRTGTAGLDRLTDLAARLLGAPTSQISLLTDVQLVAAGSGLPPGAVGSEGPLEDSLCTVTAAGAGTLVVPDAVADERVRVTVAHRGEDAPASPVDGALYGALAGSLVALRPELTVVPYLSTGATDNARLRRAGIATYGILPFSLAPADEARMHGHDERVSVDGLAFGLRVVFGAVARLACPAVADALAP